MNDNTRALLRYVCEGDIKRSQQWARIVLNHITSQKDERFKESQLKKLDANEEKMIELPYDLRGLLVAEDTTDFPESRFLLRDSERSIVEKILASLKVANKLESLGIKYLPAVMLYGKSGGGKTMLAKYIAHVANLPFVYVSFSNLVESYLGRTQSNIAKIFEFVRKSPCVLCFDEIDAVGMARGQSQDVGEMNRITISLMQEMDRMQNNSIIIGTTNRFDMLDPALIRRFPQKHEVLLLNRDDIVRMAKKFYDYAGIESDEWVVNWCKEMFEDEESAATVVEKCTEKFVGEIIKQESMVS